MVYFVYIDVPGNSWHTRIMRWITGNTETNADHSCWTLKMCRNMWKIYSYHPWKRHFGASFWGLLWPGLCHSWRLAEKNPRGWSSMYPNAINHPHPQRYGKILGLTAPLILERKNIHKCLLTCFSVSFSNYDNTLSWKMSLFLLAPWPRPQLPTTSWGFTTVRSPIRRMFHAAFVDRPTEERPSTSRAVNLLTAALQTSDMLKNLSTLQKHTHVSFNCDNQTNVLIMDPTSIFWDHRLNQQDKKSQYQLNSRISKVVIKWDRSHRGPRRHSAEWSVSTASTHWLWLT